MVYPSIKKKKRFLFKMIAFFKSANSESTGKTKTPQKS